MKLLLFHLGDTSETLRQLLLAVGVISLVWTVWVTLSLQAFTALTVGMGSLSTAVYLRWKAVRKVGLVRYLPDGIQEQLLHQTLLEWMKDATLSNKLKQYAPLLLGLSEEETQVYLQNAPTEFRKYLLAPGLIHFLPRFVKRILLPEDLHSDRVISSEQTVAPLPQAQRSGRTPRSRVDPQWAATFFRTIVRKRARSVLAATWDGAVGSKVRTYGRIGSLLVLAELFLVFSRRPDQKIAIRILLATSALFYVARESKGWLSSDTYEDIPNSTTDQPQRTAFHQNLDSWINSSNLSPQAKEFVLDVKKKVLSRKTKVILGVVALFLFFKTIRRLRKV